MLFRCRNRVGFARCPGLRYSKCQTAARTAAAQIAAGKIVAWFEGGSEFGPRALGHRSIFADLRNPQVKDLLNSRVKFRESFRPFAASVLEERLTSSLIFRPSVHTCFWSGKYDLKCRTRCQECARRWFMSVQTVGKGYSGSLRALLEGFEALTAYQPL